MDEQKGRLRRGFVAPVLAELRRRNLAIPKTGPGNKGRREHLAKVVKYLGVSGIQDLHPGQPSLWREQGRAVGA
ncbi:MAG: hypothetical protein JW751_25030 [Polyangiaceae bacterium]|nr:hypothetical protein [Polyangiaceae bacterium]